MAVIPRAPGHRTPLNVGTKKVVLFLVPTFPLMTHRRQEHSRYLMVEYRTFGWFVRFVNEGTTIDYYGALTFSTRGQGREVETLALQRA